MNIALIMGGQPRFTESFLILMSQLHGFENADIYACFWKDEEWAETPEEARSKIEAILDPRYQLKNLAYFDQPEKALPTKRVYTETGVDTVPWAYKRRYGMWLSTAIANNIVDRKYDLFIKCRPDGKLDGDLNLELLEMPERLLFPKFPKFGMVGKETNDQFVIGTREGMQFYCDMIHHIDEYIPEVCGWWEDEYWEWMSEALLRHHFEKNGWDYVEGDFSHILKAEGRSKFDDGRDRDIIPIGRDPTTDPIDDPS
jgi:hypothetical protein